MMKPRTIDGANAQQELAGVIDVQRVSEWLMANVNDAVGPFVFSVIEGGHSNLTVRITGDDGERYVLRRPPLGPVLASAHDVVRENRILLGLNGTAVPVPPVLGLCENAAVTGAPFYVMRFVDGHVLRDAQSSSDALDTQARAQSSRSIVDTLVAIHNVDLVQNGLDTLGKHDNYVARQLTRWYGQWNAQRTRDVPDIDRGFTVLSSCIPDQGPASLVHGDYRLDNCLVGDDGNVLAVLDWEICTLGDPLADLGLLLVYWTGPDDEPSAWQGDASSIPGFSNRAQLAERYSQMTGADLSHIDFYISFALWKLACILEGVHERYLAGAFGSQEAHKASPFKTQVEHAAASALAILGRTP